MKAHLALVLAFALNTIACGPPSDQSEPPPTAELTAASLHEQAIVVDGHVHIMTPVFHQGIDPWEVQETGLFDYARAKQGGLDVVIHTVYIEDPYANYNYTVKQAFRLIELFYQIVDANKDKMELALTSADVRRITADGKMAAILALEGGMDPEGDLDVLRSFHRLGVRMMQFTTHNTSNALTDAWVGEKKWGGITDRGREVIREMNRLGMMIDISHASEEAQFQIIEASQAPVVDTHTALGRFSGRTRTMSDELLKALGAKGGLMSMHHSGSALSAAYTEWERAQGRGRPEQRRHLIEGMKLFREPIGYGDYITKLDAELHDRWTRERSNRGGNGYGRPWKERQQELVDAGAPLPSVEDWVEQLEHVLSLVGDDHVGIGLDLMSGGGGLQDFDATSYSRFTEGMLKKGLEPSTVRKVLGENWLRVLDAAKVP